MIAAEDLLSAIPPRHGVVKGTEMLNANVAWHTVRLIRPPVCQELMPDPYSSDPYSFFPPPFSFPDPFFFFFFFLEPFHCLLIKDSAQFRPRRKTICRHRAPSFRFRVVPLERPRCRN